MPCQLCQPVCNARIWSYVKQETSQKMTIAIYVWKVLMVIYNYCVKKQYNLCHRLCKPCTVTGFALCSCAMQDAWMKYIIPVQHKPSQCVTDQLLFMRSITDIIQGTVYYIYPWFDLLSSVSSVQRLFVQLIISSVSYVQRLTATITAAHVHKLRKFSRIVSEQELSTYISRINA